MKKILTFLLLLVAFELGAQTVNIWKMDLPGHRKIMDTASLPDGIFASPGELVQKEAPPPPSDNGFVAKLSALKVTGLVWSNVSSQRRVLMGDIVMAEGQAIPSYVFNDGKKYILRKINPNTLHFETLDESSNPVAFDVPFGLKENLKNESDYSTSADAQKK